MATLPSMLGLPASASPPRLARSSEGHANGRGAVLSHDAAGMRIIAHGEGKHNVEPAADVPGHARPPRGRTGGDAEALARRLGTPRPRGGGPTEAPGMRRVLAEPRLARGLLRAPDTAVPGRGEHSRPADATLGARRPHPLGERARAP